MTVLITLSSEIMKSFCFTSRKAYTILRVLRDVEKTWTSQFQGGSADRCFRITHFKTGLAEGSNTSIKATKVHGNHRATAGGN